MHNNIARGTTAIPEIHFPAILMFVLLSNTKVQFKVETAYQAQRVAVAVGG